METFHLTLSLSILLFLSGSCAGLIDSIAGGGGLITLPVLLGIGIPPQYALGTNKLQGTFGSASAAAHFIHARTVSVRDSLQGVLWTAGGAALGAITVQHLDPSLLRRIIPWLLIALAVYLAAFPRVGTQDVRPHLKQGVFYPLFGLLIGFYDGFLGPGTGSFWVVAFMLGLGYNMKRGTGYTKLMNFVSNIVALVMFILGGYVIYGAGLIMGVGQACGARVGSRLVLSKGAAFVRPILIAVVLAISLKLLLEAYR